MPLLPLSNLAYTLDHSILKEIVSPNVPSTPSAPDNQTTPSTPPTVSNPVVDNLEDDTVAQDASINKSFTDIDGWYKDSILFLQNLGIVHGVEEGLFAPQNNLKRCEIIKMFAFMNEASLVSSVSTSSFNDVPNNSWYAPYLAWAKEIGLVLGDQNGNFRPNENLSREDLAVLISRYHQITQGISLELDSFEDLYSDHHLINSYARSAIYGLRFEGLMQGIGKNFFAPNTATTRGEAGHLLSNYIQKYDQISVEE